MTNYSVFMNKILISLVVLVLPIQTHAERIVVWNAPIHLYASSKTEYQAHLILSSKGIKGGAPNPKCNNGNGIYIPFSEKEILAVALTAKAIKRAVNIEYEDDAVPRNAFNYPDLTCKATTIWLSPEPGE